MITQREVAGLLEIAPCFLARVLDSKRKCPIRLAAKFEDLTGVGMRVWAIGTRQQKRDALLKYRTELVPHGHVAKTLLRFRTEAAERRLIAKAIKVSPRGVARVLTAGGSCPVHLATEFETQTGIKKVVWTHGTVTQKRNAIRKFMDRYEANKQILQGDLK